MNRTNIFAGLALVVAFALTGCAEEKIPLSLNDETVEVSQLLEVYAQLAGKTVEASPEVRNDKTLIVVARQMIRPTRSAARKCIEQDLCEQAGIVIVRRDREHVEFGFDANKKIEPTSAR